MSRSSTGRITNVGATTSAPVGTADVHRSSPWASIDCGLVRTKAATGPSPRTTASPRMRPRRRPAPRRRPTTTTTNATDGGIPGAVGQPVTAPPGGKGPGAGLRLVGTASAPRRQKGLRQRTAGRCFVERRLYNYPDVLSITTTVHTTTDGIDRRIPRVPAPGGGIS